jgi:hypothetical protein
MSVITATGRRRPPEFFAAFAPSFASLREIRQAHLRQFNETRTISPSGINNLPQTAPKPAPSPLHNRAGNGQQPQIPIPQLPQPAAPRPKSHQPRQRKKQEPKKQKIIKRPHQLTENNQISKKADPNSNPAWTQSNPF